MNSAVRRFTLFFFSLTALASCEDPSDIGLDLKDENEIGAYYDTLNIKTGTVSKTDSVLAFRQYPLPVGGYQDGALGNVKATIFTEIGLSGLKVSFGKDPVADSLVLTLDYADNMYGAQDIEPLELDIHRLTEGFRDKASYFTNSSLAYSPEVLGSTSFNPGQVDSTNRIIPARIHLSMELANELLAQNGTQTLENQFKFVEFFKGIAIVPTKEVPREVVNIVTGGSNIRTKLTLYYKNDTTRNEHNFLLSGENIRNFSKVEVNRSGTALEGLASYEVLPSSATGGESYVQSGTQLFTKLTIPNLDKLKEEHGNIIINRAELIIPVKNNSFVTILAPMYLGLYETNNTNRILYTATGLAKTVSVDDPDALDTYRSPTALRFVEKTKTEGYYKATITAYVQAMVDGKKPNNGFLITPSTFQASTSGNVLGTLSIPQRAIILNTPESPVQLRVYYSKLN